MSINNPFIAPDARQPRLQILNNGHRIGSTISFDITNTNYYAADTFSAQFTIQDPVFTPAWWSNQTQIILDLQVSIDDGQSWKSLILGQVDKVAVHPDVGTIAVNGRDLSAYFIDTQTQNAYVNQTSSQIVRKLAEQHHMTADVTPTTTLVGQYYGADHEIVSLNQFSHPTTEWNLLCSLAQHEQFDIYVTGNTLHFHPSTPPNSTPWDLIWSGGSWTGQVAWMNAMTLSMERSMTMAKDVVVVVRSWDSRSKAAVTAVSPQGTNIDAVDAATHQVFKFILAGLSASAAQAVADNQREMISRHERVVDIEAPGDLIVGARDMLRIRGTNTSWDQTYYIDSVERSISFDAGFVMAIHAKNRSAAILAASG